MVEKSTTSRRGASELALRVAKGRRPESTCKFSAIYPSGIMPYSAPLVNHTHDHTYRLHFLILWHLLEF